MDLEFTDDQDELRASVRTVLAAESSLDRVRAVVEGEGDGDRLWKTMTELGWPALTVPEAYGGLGLGAVELLVVLEELGRAAAPGPFVPTVAHFAAAVAALGTDEQRARFLEPVAAGTLTGAVAVPGLLDGAASTVTAARDGARWRLEGTAPLVPGAPEATELVVVAVTAGALAAFVVPADAIEQRVVRTPDATRTFADVDFDGCVVDDDRRLGGTDDTEAVVVALLDDMAVAEAVGGVGTCQAIFDMTLEYAKARHQFGVPIGSFQAIKHKLVDMYVALERARALAYYATLANAEGTADRQLASSVAKAAYGDCERLLFAQSIQTHGAIGYTWEHDLHILLKRAHSSEVLFGSRAGHQRRAAGQLRAGAHLEAGL